MPLSSVNSQREKEGRFYFKKPQKKTLEQPRELYSDNSLKISQGQILTKTALGICFFLTLLDSVESTKNTLPNNLPSTQNTLIKTSFSDYKIPQLEDLIIPSKEGDISVVKAKIKAGANVNHKNEFGEMALRYASENGHTEIVNELIKAGADIDASNKDGATSLHIAAQNGHLEIVKTLVEAGASVNHKNEFGEMALRYASPKGHTEIVNELIKAGADINASNKDGSTSLQVAAEKGHLEIVKVLVKAGVNVDKKNSHGEVALRYAAQNGHTEIVNELIKAGADINASNKYGATSLQVAAQNGHLEIVKTLVEAGASINHKNEFGEMALRFAAEDGHTEIVNELIKAGADIDASNKDGSTSLQVAAEKGHLEIVKVLVEAGVNVDKKNTRGEVALRYASLKGHTEIVNELIKAGADIDASNKDGATSLQAAAKNGHLEIVKVLIEADAEIDHKNKFGFDAKHFASKEGHTEVVKFLTEKKRLIDDEAKKIEILTCPVDNRYDKFPYEQPAQPAEPASPQQIQQSEEPSAQQPVQPDNVLALTATSLVMLGGAGVLLLQQIQKPAQNIQPVAQNPNEEEMILKASHLLDPINLYLDKLPFFTLEEIKPLEWKIEDNKFVLELEHQPEGLKEGIRGLFDENGNLSEYVESITGNENKSIVTFNPQFTTIVKNSNEIILQDLNFIALQNIKDQLELLCTRKNQEFEEKYGEFFMGLDFIEENKVISIVQKHFINAEDSNFKELMHFNLLNNFGLLNLDDLLKNQLQLSISENGKISYHEDFYGEDDDPEIVKKYNKRTEESEAGESRDSIHNGIRIGERFLDRTDPIAGENKIKYFVRFSEKPSDFALACTTTNRRIEFFEAKTDNQFEIQSLRPINREDAVILFDRIREAGRAPAPVIQNGAQLNQAQVQGQGHN